MLHIHVRNDAGQDRCFTRARRALNQRDSLAAGASDGLPLAIIISAHAVGVVLNAELIRGIEWSLRHGLPNALLDQSLSGLLRVGRYQHVLLNRRNLALDVLEVVADSEIKSVGVRCSSVWSLLPLFSIERIHTVDL